MITQLTLFTYEYELIINLLSHISIFLGSFYVALYNHKLPQWHVTPLWYTGLFSMLTCLTIIFQWAIGPEFPLSYWNLGKLTDMAVNVGVAVIALIMLVVTIKRNIRYSKSIS